MARARLIAIAVLALLAAAPAAAQAELTATTMYSPDRVAVIDLTLPAASIEALEDDPEGEYVEGSFRIAEASGPSAVGEFTEPLKVGIRLKGGNGSFEPLAGKAAFKVKFNEFVKDQTLLGVKKMTLNNMVQDPSMTSEVLAYDLFRSVGVTAPQTGFAQVYVNGENYGLHLNLESLDKVALEARYGELQKPQHLYEGAWAVDVEASDLLGFEVDEGSSKSLADLEALIAAVAGEAPPSFSARVAAVADLDQMTRMWAAERYIAHWDGYSGFPPNNYYLFSRSDGAFEILPWGTDQTWTNWWMPFTGKGGLLFAKCVAEDACFAVYRTAMAAARTAAVGLDPGAEASAIATLLAPWQLLEAEPRRPYTPAEVEDGVAAVLEFVERRPDDALDWLQDTAPEPEPEPKPPVVGNPPTEPPAPPTPPPSYPLSPRLEVDRSQLGRGLLLTTVSVPVPGALTQSGRFATAKGSRPACVAAEPAPAAGAVQLRCRLLETARTRLGRQRLTVTLETVFAPDGGDATTLSRTVVLPRQAIAPSRPGPRR